jgi:S1-C subfamily serine protease
VPGNDPLRRLRLRLWLVVVALLALLAYPYLRDAWRYAEVEPRPVQARGDLAADERNTIEVFERASPSVVYITTVQHVRNFWTRNVTRVPRGTGSGFIWDEDGHVVTNYHVIEGTQEAQVRLSDRRTYPAVLVGASPEHDLAVLRINVPIDRPPPVPVGTSHDLRVGQKVYAIGNPFGLDHTLTTGVVSALDRSIDNEVGGTIEHLIQTDAAINPGNSGGPLIDSAGRLIGINTAIYSPSGAYAGIGFAVPVDTVNRIVPRLIVDGRYVRPALGIGADDEVSRAVLDELGIDGILVLHVETGSAAERAGLRPTEVTGEGAVIPGDVLQGFQGRPVRRLQDLIDLLEEQRPGDTATLEVWRAGERRRLEVVLGR